MEAPGSHDKDIRIPAIRQIGACARGVELPRLTVLFRSPADPTAIAAWAMMGP